MNLPNKLTVFRVILIVPFVLVMLGSYAGWEWYLALFGGIDAYADYIALGIFIVASLTDMLDGKIARKYNLVTNFGKFMDPLADKLLVWEEGQEIEPAPEEVENLVRENGLMPGEESYYGAIIMKFH